MTSPMEGKYDRMTYYRKNRYSRFSFMERICQKRFCNTISNFQVTIIIDKLHPESVNSALSKKY